MKTLLGIALAILLVSGARADATFDINTVDLAPAHALASQSDMDEFFSMPVAWPEWETVKVVAPDGTVSTLPADVVGGHSAVFAPDAGGLWTLTNVVSGTFAKIGVAWTVFGDGGLFYTTTAESPYSVDSERSGPDRKVLRREMPPISYTGDFWAGDSSAASKLIFTSPDDIVTTNSFAGTGGYGFKAPKAGRWLVSLECAGTTQTAVLDLENLGVIISVY